MLNMRKLSAERCLELKNLVKLYLALVVVAWSFLLMLRVPTPVSMPMNHTVIDSVRYGIQSFIANPNVLQVLMLFLILYTGFVVMETLVLLRDCCMWLYSKYKNNAKNNNAVD